jgi:hypothetical protein
MKRFNKRQLIGRDPTFGRLSFRTGVIPNEKDRLRNRNSKIARNHLRRQFRGD